MIMKVSVPNRFQFKAVPSFTAMLWQKKGEVHYIGGADILPPPLESKKEAEMISRLGTEGEKEARALLIEHNLRLVVYIAKKFDNTAVGVEDLISIGTIGLIKAIDNFDISQDVRFSTYGVPMIIGEIRRFLRDNNSVRVSRSLRDTAYKAIYAKETMMKQGMREPTLQEIATEIGIPKEDIVYALDAIQNPMSLYEPVFSDNGDTLYVMDQISDKKNREDRWVEEISLSEAMKRLDVREYEIISLRFFEGKTQMEVADLIGISQAQVSRLEKNALRIMKNYLIA